MFKVDMAAIREAAQQCRRMAIPANLAKAANDELGPTAELAALATLANSHRQKASGTLLLADLPNEVRRALGLLDCFGGMDTKSLADALGEPMTVAIRLTAEAQALGVMVRQGPYWNLTSRALNLISGSLE